MAIDLPSTFLVVSCRVIGMKKLLLILIPLSFYFFNNAFAKCDGDQRTFMNNDSEALILIDPSSLKLSFYD
jgi:hypothetical protein